MTIGNRRNFEELESEVKSHKLQLTSRLKYSRESGISLWNTESSIETISIEGKEIGNRLQAVHFYELRIIFNAGKEVQVFAVCSRCTNSSGSEFS